MLDVFCFFSTEPRNSAKRMCLFFFSSSRSLCLLFLSCHVKWTSFLLRLFRLSAAMHIFSLSLSLSVSTLVLALSFAHTLCENADDFVLFFLSPLADGSMCFFSSSSSSFFHFFQVHTYIFCLLLPSIMSPTEKKH